MQSLIRSVKFNTLFSTPRQLFNTQALYYKNNTNAGYKRKQDSSIDCFTNINLYKKYVENNIESLKLSFNYKLLLDTLEKSKVAKTKWNATHLSSDLNDILLRYNADICDKFCEDSNDKNDELISDLYHICLYAVNLRLDEKSIYNLIHRFIKVNENISLSCQILETLLNSSIQTEVLIQRFSGILTTFFDKHRLDDDELLKSLDIDCISNLFMIRSMYNKFTIKSHVINLLNVMIAHKEINSLRVDKIFAIFEQMSKYSPFDKEFNQLIGSAFKALKNVVSKKTKASDKHIKLAFYEILFLNSVENEKYMLMYLKKVAGTENKVYPNLSAIPYHAKYVYKFFRLNGLLESKLSEHQITYLDDIFNKKAGQVYKELKNSFPDSTLYGKTKKPIKKKNLIERLLQELKINYQQEKVVDGFLVDILMVELASFIRKNKNIFSEIQKLKIDSFIHNKDKKCIIEINGKFHRSNFGGKYNYFTRFKYEMLKINNIVIYIDDTKCKKISESSNPSEAMKKYLLSYLNSL